VAKRQRGKRQSAQPARLRAPDSDYSDPDGNTLTLRGTFKPAARIEYAETLAGSGRHGGASGSARAAATQEDAWQRAVELLFERLAVRWVIAGAPIQRQRELLARFRVASPTERAWIRDVLREHCAEHFPEIKAP
jgi:hypothetical protein